MNSKTTEKIIKETIFKFLDPRQYQVFIFGSRATGKAKKFSDFDVGIAGKKPVSLKTLALIEEALENSDLPFKVDLVDLFGTSKKFKDLALSKIKKL